MFKCSKSSTLSFFFIYHLNSASKQFFPTIVFPIFTTTTSISNKAIETEVVSYVAVLGLAGSYLEICSFPFVLNISDSKNDNTVLFERPFKASFY